MILRFVFKSSPLTRQNEIKVKIGVHITYMLITMVNEHYKFLCDDYIS